MDFQHRKGVLIRMFRKRFFIIIALCAAFFLMPDYLVFAQDDLGDYGLSAIANRAGLKGSSVPVEGGVQIGVVVGNALSIILGLLGLVFFIIIVYAGIKWLTAQGVEENANRAKSTLQQAVFGFIFIAAAYVFTNFVVNAVMESAIKSAGA